MRGRVLVALGLAVAAASSRGCQMPVPDVPRLTVELAAMPLGRAADVASADGGAITKRLSAPPPDGSARRSSARQGGMVPAVDLPRP